MGWQPEHADNKLAYALGFIGALYQWFMNIHLPVDFWSKLIEGVLTAGLCGFAGMAGKWLFQVTRRSVTEYFKNRKK
jgi:hypothetical protein